MSIRHLNTPNPVAMTVPRAPAPRCSMHGCCTLISLALVALPVVGSASSKENFSAKYRDFPGDVPAYVEVATQAGIDHSYTGPWEYFVGGGLAVFDCNGDRLPDMYIAGGEQPAKLYINRSATASATNSTRIRRLPC